ncbi:hypothetical protein L5515_009289 [Caenorhabditis briggsae]|uniref:CUB-like domain-containing protein n=1 Tax=Caenorhabditis briggsae TaxID=6238 RepID=A0AAE9F9E1_CAEBR|nr:hypothetical protein L5515_009289 [Caenorhabditis briggsae]
MKVLVHLLLISVALCDIPIDPPCTNGNLEFNPPPFQDDLHIIYPDNSNKGAPTLFPNNYQCNIKVNVPPGMWATLNIILNTSNSTGSATAPVIVTDSLGRSENVFSASNEPFYFLGTGGSVKLNTGMSNVSFVLDMSWSAFPYVFSPTNLTLQVSDTTPPAIALCNNSFPYLVQAQSRVSALIIPPFSLSNVYQLRGVVFFDGLNWNRTYIGNAKQAFEKGRLLNSEGNFLTVMFLSPLDCSDANILLQKVENTDPVLGFQGVTCSYEKNTECQGVLETTSYPSAMMTYFLEDHYSETVKSITGNGTLDVYIGGIRADKKNLIASYKAGQTDLLLPQAFKGYSRTYVLNGNNTKASIVFSWTASDLIQHPIGSKGFITSNHYTEKPRTQWADSRIEAPKYSAFSFTIRSADITNSTTMEIMIFGNPYGITFNQTYTADNLPIINKTYYAIGEHMDVQFYSNVPSAGFYLDYEVVKSARGVFTFVTILFVLVRFA